MKIDGININLVVNTSLMKKEENVYPSALKVENTSEVNTVSGGINDYKSGSLITFYKAFFAIDENKNVVIKVVDNEGNLIRQIPPEEYLKVAESLKMVSKKLLHLEV